MPPSSRSLPPQIPQGDPEFGDHRGAPHFSSDTFTVVSSGLGMDVPAPGRIIHLRLTVFPITSPLRAGEGHPGFHPTPWCIWKMDFGVSSLWEAEVRTQPGGRKELQTSQLLSRFPAGQVVFFLAN